MADEIRLVELIVDSAQAIAGTEAAVPPLEEVAAAATAAAAAMDRYGVALDAAGAAGAKVGGQAGSGAAGVAALTAALGHNSQAATAAARDAKVVEDAIVSQGAATGAAFGLMKVSAAEWQAAMQRLGTTDVSKITAEIEGMRSAAAGTGAAVATLSSVVASSGQAASTVARDLKASEDAIISQGAAARASSGAIIELERALRSTQAAQSTLRQNLLTTPNIVQNLGDLEAFKQRIGEIAQALDQLRNKNATVADIVGQFPQLSGAITGGSAALRDLERDSKAAETALKSNSIAQRELTAELDKFRAGATTVDGLLQKYPGLIAGIGGGLGVLSQQYKNASATLEEFRGTQAATADIIAKYPQSLTAASASAVQYAQAHAAANAPLREFENNTKDAAGGGTLLQRVLQGMGVDLKEIQNESSGSAGKLREFAVLVREISRGDTTRLLGSLSIELRNFGLLGLVFNPIVLGLGAVTGALIAATVRAGTLREELRTFQTDINFFQPGGAGNTAITPQYLQGVQQQLVDTGFLSRGESQAVVQQSIRAMVPQDFLPEITQISEALTRLYGGDAASWASKLINAFSGGYNEIAKFGSQTHTINAAELDDIRDLSLGGDKLATQQAALQAIYAKTAGVIHDSTGPGKEAVESLSVAFDHMLNALANSAPIQGFREGLIGILQTVTELTKSEGWLDFVKRVDQATRLSLPNILPTPPDLLSPIYNALPGGNTAARGDLTAALAERWGMAPTAVAGVLAGTAPAASQLAAGGAINSSMIASVASATVDALASGAASSTQLGSLATTIQQAQGLETGGSLSSAADAQKTTVDQNTDAVRQLTTALMASADKVSIGTLSSGGALSAALSNSIAGASSGETDLLAQIRQRESGGRYDIFHATGQIVSSLSDVQALPGDSHAFGAYGFQPGTYRMAASGAGFNPNDISPANQDAAALWLLRNYGPNSSISWRASGPYDTAGLSGASSPLFDVSAALGGPASSNAQTVSRQLGQTFSDLKTSQFTSADFGGVFSDTVVKGLNDSASVPSSDEDIKKANAIVTALKEQAGARGLEGAAADKETVAINALKKAQDENINGVARNVVVTAALSDQQGKLDAQNNLAATQNARLVTGQNSIAEAYQRSAVEGEKASAAYEAQAKSIQTNVNAGQAEIQILAARTAQALQYGAQRIASSQQQLQADQRLADASSHGTQALAEQQIQNKAIADTLDVRTKAEAALEVAQAQGTDADKQKAKAALDAANAEQTRAQAIEHSIAVTQQFTALNQQINSAQDETAVLQLQLSLQGQNSAEIDKQVSLLRLRQQISHQSVPDTQEDRDALDASNQKMTQLVTQQGNLHIAIQQATKEQQGFNDAIKKAADSIDTTLTTAITNAFDGQKAVDWGQTIRKVIAQIVADLANFAVIRPLIGTALGALGFGQAAQGFGSLFGGGGGGGAALAGGAAGAGGLSTGTLLQGAGLAKDAFGGSLFGGTGGITGFINNTIGGPLGFATSVPLSESDIAAVLPAGISPEGITGSVLQNGSLFGGTTLTSALGGIGIGVGAGGLLSSVLGGNPTIGSVGGGLGGLAGGIIAPLLGIAGPIGGIVGGLLGGLGGLFGNNKPSNLASGGNLNLSSGTFGGFSSSGNQQNDQIVQQISSTLGQFIQQVTTATGGTLSGSVNIQAGTRDGIKTSYNGPLGNIDASFPDAQTAIQQFEQAILQNLEGVSGTLKTVLAHVTDPSQLQSAVQFATAYDNLKKAADSAFSSISTDEKTVGPFQSALQTLQTTFQDLTNQANQFGLSLDPINAGLAEATRRLQDDFGKALDNAINQASGNDFINQLIAVSATFATNTRDAIAIGLGGDAGTTGKVGQLETLQAQAILGGLTPEQLQAVANNLGQSNPEIAAMAQAMLAVGTAATAATNSVANLSSSLGTLHNAIAQLTSGNLSGLPPAQQASASVGNFDKILAAVQAGDLSQIPGLSSAATTAVSDLQTAYGNAPATSDQRARIIAALNSVDATASAQQAAGTPITGPLGLATNPLVLSAQAAAAAAAAVAGPSAAAPVVATTTVVAPAAAAPAPPVAFSPSATGSFLASHAFASGTDSTPPGTILVGEHGPELISQRGGLSVIPISSHPGWSWRGGGDPAMIEELRALRAQFAVLQKQLQGGQIQAAKDAEVGNTHLDGISRNTRNGGTAPQRRVVQR